MKHKICKIFIKLFKIGRKIALSNANEKCYYMNKENKAVICKGDDNMLRSDIKQIADNLRAEYGLNHPPIDVEQLCSQMKIPIEYMDMSAIEKKLGQPISGAIISVGPDAHIKINSHDTPQRQTFTIAHELGHKLLHIHDDPDGVIVSFRCLKNDREREADTFAAELLMPDALVKSEYNKLFYPLVSQLAGTFHVSQSAMKYKLDELGLSYIA